MKVHRKKETSKYRNIACLVQFLFCPIFWFYVNWTHNWQPLFLKKTARLFIVELFIQITIKCNNPACRGDIRNQIFLWISPDPSLADPENKYRIKTIRFICEKWTRAKLDKLRAFTVHWTKQDKVNSADSAFILLII